MLHSGTCLLFLIDWWWWWWWWWWYPRTSMRAVVSRRSKSIIIRGIVGMMRSFMLYCSGDSSNSIQLLYQLKEEGGVYCTVLQ